MTRIPPEADAPEITEWSGKYIEAKRRARWEYASRRDFIGAAVILAIDGGHVILVEQYRAALGRLSLELPAGLIGDEDGTQGEDAITTGRRELEEETGYTAAQWSVIGEFASSPGIVSEMFTLVKATGLSRLGEGGGVGGEDIEVYRIPLESVTEFVRERRAAGSAIDSKLLVVLGAWLLDDAAQ